MFNLTRFARDKYDHFALRSLLQSLGISLRSATEPIDDTSTGKLMEGVLAAFAQFDNDVRSHAERMPHRSSDAGVLGAIGFLGATQRGAPTPMRIAEARPRNSQAAYSHAS